MILILNLTSETPAILGLTRMGQLGCWSVGLVSRFKFVECNLKGAAMVEFVVHEYSEKFILDEANTIDFKNSGFKH